MASKLNLPGMQQLLNGVSNWLSTSYRVRLLMTNTTADTENNIATLSAYTTLDKFNGSGFSDNLALTGKAATVDAINNRVFLDADDVAFGALGSGTRPVQGMEVFAYNGADSSSVPFVFIEFSATFNPAGAQVTIQWDVNGIVQFA